MPDTYHSLLSSATAGDILLFSNSSGFNSSAIQKLTGSEWNHAAVVAGVDHQDGAIYIHEYPAIGAGIRKQQLRSKLAENNLAKVCLIRDPQLAGRKSVCQIEHIINNEYQENVDAEIKYSMKHAGFSAGNKILAIIACVLLAVVILPGLYFHFVHPEPWLGKTIVGIAVALLAIAAWLGICNIRNKSPSFMTSEKPVKGSFCSGYVARVDDKLGGQFNTQLSFASLHTPEEIDKYAGNIHYQRYVFHK